MAHSGATLGAWMSVLTVFAADAYLSLYSMGYISTVTWILYLWSCKGANGAKGSPPP